MRGISEERLKQLIDNHQFDSFGELEESLLSECKELNPWFPIEKAPKDEFLLMFIPGHGKEVMLHREIKMWSPKPTHYQKLPEDPKE